MAEQPAVTFYREGDADPDGLSGQTIAVVGYGNLGRSMALNLRDSGLTVTVGNVDDDYRATAQADGFEVSGVGEAVATADVVYVLIPDEVIPEVFRDEVAPRLRSGADRRQGGAAGPVRGAGLRRLSRRGDAERLPGRHPGRAARRGD